MAVIINGNDRPYIIKKMFGKINAGFSHKRVNTTRTPLLRRDLDEIYEEKAGYPPIDIKFTDRIAYYNAFDEYHTKNNPAPMTHLFARYVDERLEYYLRML